jgi:hypothetical protein
MAPPLLISVLDRFRPLYRRHPLDRRLGGPQSLSGWCGEEKNCLSLPGIEPRLVTIPTDLSRLCKGLKIWLSAVSSYYPDIVEEAMKCQPWLYITIHWDWIQVKMFQCLNKCHAMKAASSSARINPKEIVPGTIWMGGLQSKIGRCAKRKYLTLAENRTPILWSFSQSLGHYTEYVNDSLF